MPSETTALELLRIEILKATRNVRGKTELTARSEAVILVRGLYRAAIEKRARHLAEFHGGSEPNEEDTP